MTGLYPHQAGIGGMSEDPYDKSKRDRSPPHDKQLPGYRGFINRNSVTLAEVMKEAGYHTYMVGKWHLGMDGMEKWPLQRGDSTGFMVFLQEQPAISLHKGGTEADSR